MDKLDRYRTAIRQVMKPHLSPYSVGDIEVSEVIDSEHDHFQVFAAGWANGHYHHGPTVSMQIKNGKIWIHHNGTDSDLAQELVSLGVPKNDIVLGWQAPAMRKFTEYAVG
jgi:hypothetical protein